MRSISEMSYANIEIIFQKVLSFLCVMVYNICIEFVRGVFMKFCDKLNEYIETLSCTSKELCELSGISEATFSRYKTFCFHIFAIRSQRIQTSHSIRA